MLDTPHPPRITFDACVLMSGVARRLLLRLAEGGLLRPAWSERIGQEWRRNAARVWGTPPAALQAEWDDMQSRFPLACMAPAPEHETGLRYSDPRDWHVIGTARAALAAETAPLPRRGLILTWNLKDFNRSELRRLGLDALDPDRLLSQSWPAHGHAIRAALAQVAQDAASWGHRPEPLADTLRRERLFRLQRLAADDARQPGPPALG